MGGKLSKRKQKKFLSDANKKEDLENGTKFDDESGKVFTGQDTNRHRIETTDPRPISGFVGQTFQQIGDTNQHDVGVDQPQPNQLSDGDLIVALFDFDARSDKEVGFKQHDRMILIRVEDREWLFARHEKSGAVGFVPANYVAQAESLDLFEWYFGEINRREAEALLSRHPDGTFLVRYSFSNPGDFALSLKYYNMERKSHVRHYVIKYSNFNYSIWGKKNFSNLNDLIEEYKIQSYGLPVLLYQPCPRIRPTMNELSVETKDEWEIDRSEIQLQAKIGSGNFGEVYCGKWKGRIDVAVKTLKKGTMPDGQFLDEASIMKGLKHENILSLLATCSKGEPIYIITQYMQNGSLLHFLKQCKDEETITYDQMLEFAFQISKGMLYLENKNLIHRDLAARNVLVDDRLTCKIADFGLAKLLVGTSGHSFSSGKFPVKWSPPEVLTEGKFSIKSDVWSFGIVMIEIFTYGDALYSGMTQKQVRTEVVDGLHPSQPPLCPVHIYEVLLKCWDPNPQGRPLFRDLKAYLDDSSHKVNDGTQYLLQ